MTFCGIVSKQFKKYLTLHVDNSKQKTWRTYDFPVWERVKHYGVPSICCYIYPHSMLDGCVVDRKSDILTLSSYHSYWENLCLFLFSFSKAKTNKHKNSFFPEQKWMNIFACEYYIFEIIKLLYLSIKNVGYQCAL